MLRSFSSKKEETLYEEENTAKVPSEITLTHKQSAEGEEDDEIYDHHDDHYDDDDDNDEVREREKSEPCFVFHCHVNNGVKIGKLVVFVQGCWSCLCFLHLYPSFHIILTLCVQ